MTTRDHDTDPSTPGAKRPLEGRGASLAPAALQESDARAERPRPKTDPGIAPHAGLLPVPDEPMGIVVPSAAARPDESVDILLDGISSAPSDGAVAVVSQAEGHGAASYHAEHAVAPGRASPTDEPKVVIARPLPDETVRIAPGAYSSHASLPDLDPKAWTETTAAKARPLATRVFVAVGAGVAVVVGIFFALHRTLGSGPLGMASGPVGPTSSASASVAPVPSATGAVAPTRRGAPEIPAVSAAPEVTAEPPPLAGSVASASAPNRRGAQPPRLPRTRARPAQAPPKGPTGDLGEFKGSF